MVSAWVVSDNPNPKPTMKTITICRTLLLLAPVLLLSTVSAQVRLGPTTYGFGVGAAGPEGPRSLTIDPLKQGTSVSLWYSMGKPRARVLAAMSAAPRYSPLPLAGAQIFIDPETLFAIWHVNTDANGSAKVPLGQIPNVRTLTGLTIYGQAFEVSGSSLLQSTAFAAQAAVGCTVQAQATGITFSRLNGTAQFKGITVPNGCIFKVIGKNVALPANGVTITRHARFGTLVTVTFDHLRAPVGTKVSIQLELHCTCGNVTSQHFLYARGTK